MGYNTAGTMKRGKAGLILNSVAALTAVGGFLADWNRTHLFNPDWPPHARFHDALSICLGSLFGASGLNFLHRRGEEPGKDLALGALLPSLFWIAQGTSFLFPGAEGFEAEFPEKVPRVKGVWVNERFFSVLMLSHATGRHRGEGSLPVGKRRGTKITMRPQPMLASHPVPSQAMSMPPGSDPAW